MTVPGAVPNWRGAPVVKLLDAGEGSYTRTTDTKITSELLQGRELLRTGRPHYRQLKKSQVLSANKEN